MRLVFIREEVTDERKPQEAEQKVSSKLQEYTFKEYQAKSVEFDTFDKSYKDSFNRISIDNSILEKLLGLNGEVGEVTEIIKKAIRDKNSRLGIDDLSNLKKELGDVLWYLTNLSNSLGMSLEDIAKQNYEKLKSRKERNTIHGSGDNR